MLFFEKLLFGVWTWNCMVMRYPKKLTLVVLCKATRVHGKVTMAKRSRKKAKNSKFQSIFLKAYLSSFQVLVNGCCVQKQEKDVSKNLVNCCFFVEK
jgi:hypothetical protein